MMNGPDNGVKLVVSVCEIKDLGAWRIAAPRIVANIAADRYQLVCPDRQIPDFSAVTEGGWSLSEESLFTGNCSIEMIRDRVTGHNRQRVHWLYQQFIKINAVLQSGLDDDAIVLIWDADTVPLRRIDFQQTGSRQLNCYSGKERHQPYFDTIEKLLGYGPVVGRSFIAQSLPVRVGWVRGMVEEIERRFSSSYVEAVLKLLPGESGSEFSEYETIGSWVFHHHSGELTFRKNNRWLRSGPRLFGEDLSGKRTRWILWLLSGWFDFVAIEKWDRPLDLQRMKAIVSRRIGRR